MVTHDPKTAAELVELITDATTRGAKLQLCGGGTLAEVGAPTDCEIVNMRGFSGVIDYDPAELVLTVGAGTPLDEVHRLLAQSGQHLAFEPWDMAPLFGRRPGASTIGGIVASGQAGSGRLAGGGVRDHLLGFSAVSGRGEPFVAGGKVVKNVTGYDLPKLMAGSWGRLAALTTLSLKTLPRPRESVTRSCTGLSVHHACRIFDVVLRSRVGIAAAAHVQSQQGGGPSLTALRIDGFGPSVRSRLALLNDLLADAGLGATCLGTDATIWEETRSLLSLGDRDPLWRVSLPISACPQFLAELHAVGGRYVVDWGGARIWLSFDGNAAIVRDAAARLGGHAMLMRATAHRRAAVASLHPQSPPLAALEARVRRAFDPAGVFETGRFG